MHVVGYFAHISAQLMAYCKMALKKNRFCACLENLPGNELEQGRPGAFEVLRWRINFWLETQSGAFIKILNATTYKLATKSEKIQ